MVLSPVRHHYCRAAFAVLFTLLAAAGCARAQTDMDLDGDPGDMGTGGRNAIQGHIYYPGGRRVDAPVHVRIRSIQGGEQSTTSDNNGTFIFRRLRGGTYYITVEPGKEYEAVSETVDIIEPARRRGDASHGQVVMLHINLEPKRGTPAPPAATVDAAMVGVPEEALKLYREALLFSKQGNSTKAVERLKMALKVHSEFMIALNELGLQYMNLSQNDKAAEALRSALKLAPEAFAPQLNYGILLVKMKNFKEGAGYLHKALEKNSSSGLGHFYMGRASIGLDDYTGAEKELQQAVVLGGTETIEAHRLLGVVYMQKREDAHAAEELEKYLQLSPKCPDAARVREIIKQLRGSR